MMIMIHLIQDNNKFCNNFHPVRRANASKKNKRAAGWTTLFSRVKRQSALKVLLPPENPTHTRNVVWKEVLNKKNSPAAPASPTRNYLDNMEDFAIDD